MKERNNWDLGRPVGWWCRICRPTQLIFELMLRKIDGSVRPSHAIFMTVERKLISDSIVPQDVPSPPMPRLSAKTLDYPISLTPDLYYLALTYFSYHTPSLPLPL